MKKFKFIWVAGLLVIFLMLHACALRQDLIDSKLFLGLSNAKGSISKKELTRFIDTTALPLFPGGMTVYFTSGFWRNKSNALEKESSAVLEIIHVDCPANQIKLQKIIDAYKLQYLQEAVILTQEKPKIRFY